MEQPATRPALIAAGIVCLTLGGVFVAQIFLHRVAYPVEMMELGTDYRTIHTAAREVSGGFSPYTIDHYNTPPLCAWLAVPVSRLSFEHARWIWLALVPTALLAAYAMAMELFVRDGPERTTLLVCGLAVAGLSYPVHFLIDRGNMDHLVFVLVMLGLLWADTRTRLAGLCIAAAISLKLYPALLLAPIILGRRWRLLLWVVAAQGVLMAPLAGQWNEFLTGRLFQRWDSYLSIAENGGIASVFFAIGHATSQFASGGPEAVSEWTQRFVDFGLCVWAVLLGCMVYAHLRRGARSHAALAATSLLYVPFMVAIPKHVFTYELVGLILMLPLSAHLWRAHPDPRARRAIVLIAAGAGLAQFHAGLLTAITQSAVPHVVSATGTLLCCAGCTLLSLRTRTSA